METHRLQSDTLLLEEIGVLLSLQEPTKPMRTEAMGAGFYESPWGTRHPRIQLLTVTDLLLGKGVNRPT